MAFRAQMRGDTAAVLSARNEVLLSKEFCFETDTNLFKLGDGVTPWNALGYWSLTPLFSGPATFDAIADPSVPAAGQMRLYASDIAGRLMPKVMGPSGLDNPLQSGLQANKAQVLAPGSSTAFSMLGLAAPTVVGTLSHPNMVSGISLRQATARGIITSAATANAASEVRVVLPQCYRGEVFGTAISGGFFFSCRFAVSSIVANQRCIVGLFNSTAALSTTLSPSAGVNFIGMGWDSTDANAQIMFNDGAGVATKINLGAGFPASSATAMYELSLFCKPNGDEVGYRARRMDTGETVSGTLTTDLPAKAALLSWHAYSNNGGTAAASVLEIVRMYLETDY